MITKFPEKQAAYAEADGCKINREASVLVKKTLKKTYAGTGKMTRIESAKVAFSVIRKQFFCANGIENAHQ